jgi:hypothetical protein
MGTRKTELYFYEVLPRVYGQFLTFLNILVDIVSKKAREYLRATKNISACQLKGR